MPTRTSSSTFSCTTSARRALASSVKAARRSTSTGAALRISAGSYYVDGIRCELRPDSGAVIDFVAQPFLPAATLPTTDGIYLAYLDVWERPITAVEDPSIREVALGGPDTATRTQVVWQLRLLGLAAPGPTPTCVNTYSEWDALVAGSTGTLEVRVQPGGTSSNPCVVAESAGFRGIENQLYRVQIHDIDSGGGPRFKWSRDNGSVVASILNQPSASEIEIDRVGPGGAAGFDLGTWVELTHDTDDLLQRPGRLGRITDIEQRVRLSLDLDGAFTLIPDRHPRARRWDSAGALPTSGGWLPIEDGIEVRFTGASLRPGDSWLIPARTALLPGSSTRQIEWPEDGSLHPLALRPEVPRHSYARIAMLQRSAGVWTVIGDCRKLFPSLTNLIALDTRGGDGQHGRSGQFLPAPITVGVSRGRLPVENARVRFALVADPSAGTRGALSAAEPTPPGVAATSQIVDVLTDSAGLAKVYWKLGDAPTAEAPSDLYQPELAQLVEARLLLADGSPDTLATRFVAIASDDLTLVAAGGEGQIGRPGQVLPIALRARISAGSRAVPGAAVRFIIMDDMFGGTALDQFSGGSIHASANVISTVPWSGGARMREAVVSTDASGVAQVQWTLGTDVRLPTQRVTAVLLGNSGLETAQSTLFGAQLALAQPLSVDARVVPDGHVLAENERIVLAQFKSLEFKLALGPQFDKDVRLTIEALLPYSYGATGLRPVDITTPTPLFLRTVLLGVRAQNGASLTWSLNAVEREALTRAVASDTSHAGIVFAARIEPIAADQGQWVALPWIRTFRIGA